VCNVIGVVVCVCVFVPFTIFQFLTGKPIDFVVLANCNWRTVLAAS